MEYYRSTGGFTCNASGAGKEQTVPSTGHWAAIWVTAYAADSSGVWQTGEPGHPYLQNAASAVMGPVVLQPGQPMVTQISGATAGVDTTIEYRGWFSDVGDGSDLTGIIGTEITSGSITLPTPVPVSDGGLAGTIAQQLSVVQLYAAIPLAANATTSYSAGANTAHPYPSQVGAWMIQIVGIGSSGGGARVLWTGMDASGNTIYQRQRDSSTIVYGSLQLTGDVDAPALSWAVTLSSSAPAGCFARLYFSAGPLEDDWYDTSAYGPVFSSTGGNLGMDGTLLAVQNVGITGGSSSLSYTMLTYRGPVQIGCQMSQAGFLAISEFDYTGASLRLGQNFLVSASGSGYILTVAYLGGLNVHITGWNTSASTSQMYLVVRGIKDLV